MTDTDMTAQDASPVEWGPEIAVNGERPDGLADDDRIAFRFTLSGNLYGYDAKLLVRNFNKRAWRIVDMIRLPADHALYRHKFASSEIAPNVVARMVALVMRMAYGWIAMPDERRFRDEACDIAALLPEPIDPDEQYATDLMREQGWGDEPQIGAVAVATMIAMARRAGRDAS